MFGYANCPDICPISLATLQAAFKARAVEKTYLALVHGAPPETGRLDTMYGRHPGDRTRFTSRGEHTRRAVTGWKVLEAFGGRAALLEEPLEPGPGQVGPEPHQRQVQPQAGQLRPRLGGAPLGRRAGAHQMRDLTCPFDFRIMSTMARSK